MGGGEEGRQWSAERGHAPAPPGGDPAPGPCADGSHPPCCPYYHEAIAYVALERFTAMVNVAGDVPVDGSVEDTRTLRAA